MLHQLFISVLSCCIGTNNTNASYSAYYGYKNVCVPSPIWNPATQQTQTGEAMYVDSNSCFYSVANCNASTIHWSENEYMFEEQTSDSHTNKYCVPYCGQNNQYLYGIKCFNDCDYATIQKSGYVRSINYSVTSASIYYQVCTSQSCLTNVSVMKYTEAAGAVPICLFNTNTCPSGVFLYQNNCYQHCTTGFISLNYFQYLDKMQCVADCKAKDVGQSQPYYEYTSDYKYCLKNCAAATINQSVNYYMYVSEEEGYCYIDCTGHHYASTNSYTCVDSCTLLFNNTCQQSCSASDIGTSIDYFVFTDQEPPICVQDCYLFSYVRRNSSSRYCDPICPSSQVAMNNTCYMNCSKQSLGTSTDYFQTTINGRPNCVYQCSQQSMYGQNGVCVRQCQSGYYLYVDSNKNGNCFINCTNSVIGTPSDYYYIENYNGVSQCIKQCTDINYVHQRGSMQCIASCGVLALYQNVCYANCSALLLNTQQDYYLANGVCVASCQSLNMFISSMGSTVCTSSCIQFVSNNTCVSSCAKRQYNNKCYDSCADIGMFLYSNSSQNCAPYCQPNQIYQVQNGEMVCTVNQQISKQNSFQNTVIAFLTLLCIGVGVLTAFVMYQWWQGGKGRKVANNQLLKVEVEEGEKQAVQEPIVEGEQVEQKYQNYV